ncbi:hypothetical protein Tco_0032575 [Tanacetum coccineum]
MELKTSSSFKTTGLLQPWQTLCKIFSKCLTTRVTGWDQPPLQIMQMMYCFVNIIHVDYAELLWEGIYYSLHHPTSSIPYPRFTKIIKAIDNQIPSQVDVSVRSYMSGHILHVHPVQSQTQSVPEQQYQLYLFMKNDPQPSAVRPRDQGDPHDDAHPEGKNSAKRQKTSEYKVYVSGESSSRQVNEEERDPLTQDIMEEVSLTIDEAKLKKMADEMLRQRCTSGDEHQYHIDQMKNFLKSDIIVTRRANECIVSITKPDYKNLNKNDIEDMYLLIMNGKVPDYAETGLLWSLSVFIRSSMIWERVHDFQLGIESYQHKVNLTAPIISFPGVEKHRMFSIIYEPVHGIIYKNNKKDKRVMRHSEIHKFYDATLNRVLEGLKSYNNDVKYGYVQRELTNDEVEYLKLFEEEIDVRLKYRNQMRRWEMYVNGRPLGPRRERPE